ncbi:TetR/AcrR family transcriptional regulator [Pseudoduganella violaceinigra]|uniref:TetR/AcrR family transcriptional regulator n=1 Tax=Pseudoduganella violaceinigra TaxID=246602 RepID=UPI0004297AB9|nr:TetR family transcriptional regulator [Pseudoduganella violaceinigra]
MSRRPKTAQRRSEIVQALLATMAEHGYEKATIQLIAQAAGLAPGLIHYHFKTKGEILLELVKTLAQLAQQRYLALAADAATPQARLQAYLDARLGQGAGADPRAVAAWVVIGAEALRLPEVRAVYQEAIAAERALLEDLLGACLAARGQALHGVSALAAALLALMQGAFQLASAAPGSMPDGYAVPMARQLAERCLAAP